MKGNIFVEVLEIIQILLALKQLIKKFTDHSVNYTIIL